MTYREHIEKAIEHLKVSIDIDPDKDDHIRLYNDMLYGIIAQLKITLGEKYDD